MSDASGPPQSKAQYVSEQLRADIVAGVIPPGVPLKQLDIAARYGVSPTPVREALRKLEADGLISYSHSRGATVAELAVNQVTDLFLLRAEVEGLATRLAVMRMPDDPAILENIEALEADLESSLGTASGADLARKSRLVHLAIYDQGSTFISDHAQSILRVIPPQATTWQLSHVAELYVTEHREIIAAVRARDADLAERLMQKHIHSAASFRVGDR